MIRFVRNAEKNEPRIGVLTDHANTPFKKAFLQYNEIQHLHESDVVIALVCRSNEVSYKADMARFLDGWANTPGAKPVLLIPSFNEEVTLTAVNEWAEANARNSLKQSIVLLDLTDHMKPQFQKRVSELVEQCRALCEKCIPADRHQRRSPHPRFLFHKVRIVEPSL